MIPNHILNDLGPEDRVAILVRQGRLQFLVHRSADTPDAILAHAARDGSEVLATHMQDKVAILELVGERERDVGGEG